MANRPLAHLTDRAPSHVFPGPRRRPGWILGGAHPRRRNRQVAHTYQETNGGRRTTFRAECVLIRAIRRTPPIPHLPSLLARSLVALLQQQLLQMQISLLPTQRLAKFPSLLLAFSSLLFFSHPALPSPSPAQVVSPVALMHAPSAVALS